MNGERGGAPTSLGVAWRWAGERLGRRDARWLLECVSGCSHAELIAQPERVLTPEQSRSFETLVKRCETGEPLAYLVGHTFFCGLEFAVSPAVLIPRPETEVLVDLAVARARRFSSPRLVDLGTGSGIVAILLARRCPDAAITATDVSTAALTLARENARRHGVALRFAEGNWFAPLAGEHFELIVANPPYIAENDPHLWQDGLPFEPRQALTDGVAGGDGTACLRKIISGAPTHLQAGGWLLLEHGYDQAVEVRARLAAAGFGAVTSWRDAAGIERVSGGRMP